MTNENPLSEQEILQRMRDHVNSFREGSALSTSRDEGLVRGTSVHGYDLRRLLLQVEIVNDLKDAVGAINPRPKGLLNSGIQFVKKTIHRLLGWYTRSLLIFHSAVTRAMGEQLQALQSFQQQLKSQKRDLENTLLRLHDQVNTVSLEIDKVRGLQVDERLRNQELKLRILESARLSPERKSATETPARQQIDQSSVSLDFNYSLFEAYYRGDEALIGERQREYVPYFQAMEPVWDLGCGRGEFLQELREAGIAAEGVESNRDAFQTCIEKKLRVTHGDLFAFLESAEDKSAGGIFSAQVIEHLTVPLQIRLVKMCYRKLKPGGILVLETINPQCIFALSRNFYLDPTHVRPVHPDLMRFILESEGFRNVQISFSSPVEGKYLKAPSWKVAPDQEQMTEAIMNLNNIVFGNQDYAAIARRPETAN